MRTILSLLVLALLAVGGRGHTFLTKPEAFNQKYRTQHCRDKKCEVACPIEFATGMANSVEKPAAIWRRGDTEKVRWVRNNHFGGMVRLSLVPVALMDSRKTHEQLAFMYGCWATGPRPCKDVGCGSDQQGVGFGRSVRVPTVYPDGSYVLGLAWFGGKKPHGGSIGDFYSCSHVRIAGGPLGGKMVAPFEPGENRMRPEAVRNGKCLAVVDRLGVCGRGGCMRGTAQYLAPFAARPGAQKPVTVKVVKPMLDLPLPDYAHGTVPRTER